MQPDAEQFREWQGHPVTEWVMAVMRAHAGTMKAKWADIAWEGGIDPDLLNEARVRADCYLAIPNSTLDDWKALDDTQA